MQIKRLVIENFKSIERIELVEPNPFTVFVGPNGSGKSNIFEALEFVASATKFRYVLEAVRLFGGEDKLFRRVGANNKVFVYNLYYGYDDNEFITLSVPFGNSAIRNYSDFVRPATPVPLITVKHFIEQYRRILVNSPDNKKRSPEYTDNDSLNFAATNLEPVLKRVLSKKRLREEIFEWLALFVPGFKAVEVDDRDELHWFEESNERYFTKDLISGGTYNILALLTAVYQSDEPQFLCIEEPENGLHPEVLESLIGFFRKQYEEKGHYIWLNTHSESIVKLLTTDEIVLVNKRDGATQTKQVKGMNTYSLTTDQAWLSGALGGGLAW